MSKTEWISLTIEEVDSYHAEIEYWKNKYESLILEIRKIAKGE